MNYPVVVLTCDAYLECLKPFAWLFNKYWSSDQKVIVGGFSLPDFKLPSNFEFISLGRNEDYPVHKYSDGLIKFLHWLRDDVFMWMLEDQWLHGYVNPVEIQTMIDVARNTRDLLRIDVIDDRRWMNEFTFGKTEPFGTFNGIDLIKSPWCPYQFAIYGTIFRRQAMLKYLQTGLTPWEVETATTNAIEHAPVVVLGTTRKLIQAANGLRQQKPLFDDGKRGIDAAGLEGGIVPEDLAEMTALGIYNESRLLKWKK